MKKTASALGALALALAVSPPALAAQDADLEQQWRLAASPGAVKLLVREDGWYRVRRSQLVAAGLPRTANNRLLQLYADGRQVPMLVQRGGIEFYGIARDTATTDTRTYWLVQGAQPGRRIGLVKGARAAGARLARSFAFTAERKPRVHYFTALRDGDGENLFGPRVTSEPVTQTVGVHHLDRAGRPLLEVRVLGLSTTAHRIKVSLNGVEVGTLAFEGQVRATLRRPVAARLVKDGDNAVTLAALAGDADFSVLDHIRLTYAHAYQADDDVLRLRLARGKAARVGGFASRRIRLVDITDRNSPQLLTPSVSRYRGRFAVRIGPAARPRVLLALAQSRAKRPAGVVRERPSTWHRAAGADLVLIGHRAFLPALRPLVELRERQGLKVTVIDVDDLYDEFAFGAHDPYAVKRFLARAKAAWRPAPRFVILAGDSSFDPRNYLGHGHFDFVPTKLIDTNFMEAPSDDWFADFDDNGVPELAVGRLPVRTAAQAAAVVGKIVGYEGIQSAAAASRGALLVADEPDGFDFQGASERLRDFLAGSVPVQMRNRTEGPDAQVRSRLLADLNQGPAVVNFFGHAAVDIWTKSGLLKAADTERLANAGRLSVYVVMACLNGYFVDPRKPGLAEALLTRENAGAVAVWASGGLIEFPQQPVMNRELFRLLLADPTLTLGEAAMRAKTVVRDRDLRKTFILFGDPTTRLRW